ncbi:MAG: hypothetical protein WKF59_03085 [Chitinophagaceae bacterium]
MAAKQKKPNANNLLLRNASDFYPIPLEDDYTLTEEALRECIDKRPSKQVGWFYPDLKLLSYKDGVTELLNKVDRDSFSLFIKVEKEKLLAACSCSTQVEKLCVHAFNALLRLLNYDRTITLKMFLPDAVQTVFTNRQYFETKPGIQNLFKPKAILGSVYAIKEALADYNIEDVLTLPAQPKAETKETTICYVLMISRRHDLLPFLIPCIGKFNKAGTRIKVFSNFLSGIQKEHEPSLSEEQKTLNRICYDMYKLVEKLPDQLIHGEMLFNGTEDISDVFSLWQKAFKLLLEQHTYIHPLFRKRQLKGKPTPSWMIKINMQKNVPVIQFQLSDKGAFYQLQMKPVINGKAINKYKVPDTFFISSNKNVYMLPSVRDAAIAEWMEKSGNRIAVFKENFADFEKAFTPA